MGQTFSNVDSALKEDYKPVIREQLNDKALFLSQIDKNTESIEGRRAVLSIHTSRNEGVGARRDGVALPTAGNEGFAEERIPVMHNYGSLELSGPAMRAMKSDKGSFTRTLQYATKGVTNTLKLDVNRQAFGDGTGAIAETTVSTTGQTTVLLAAATTTAQMRQFRPGMAVDIGTLAELNAGSGGPTYNNIIVSVSVSGKSFVLTSNLGSATASGDFVSRAGAGGALGGSTQKEITGLEAIIAASGALHNVTDASWVSTVNTTGGTPTENLFARVMHDVQIASGEDITMIVTSDDVHRNYANNLTSQKRFSNTIELHGGYKSIDVAAGGGSVPLVWDRDCRNGIAYFLNPSHLVQFEQTDWEWLDDDGSVLHQVAGFDKFAAVLYKDHELATDMRCAFGKATGLTGA